MSDLKLGPLPKAEKVRLMVAMPKPLKEALDLYAAEHSRLYGPVDTTVLIPYMLEAFIRSDRAFMRRHGKAVPARGAQAPTESPRASRRCRPCGRMTHREGRRSEPRSCKVVCNRQRLVKDPDTAERQARPSRESERIIQDIPELRIIGNEPWQAVKARQAENRIERDDKATVISARSTVAAPRTAFRSSPNALAAAGAIRRSPPH
ncbi:DUF2274 domain-containing protein [Inquilinus sp. OTU3971]|uniref:DUF2274 domain-containing protein n=1 Tax=Inquilinus sp. OTU3971 TaxID=3043855 RepID=UPI00406CA7FC